MATSIPANASSPASISPVGPPPAMTTVPPVDLSDPPIRLLLTPEVLASAGDHAARPGACGKSPPWRYSVYGGRPSQAQAPLAHSRIASCHGRSSRKRIDARHPLRGRRAGAGNAAVLIDSTAASI